MFHSMNDDFTHHPIYMTGSPTWQQGLQDILEAFSTTVYTESNQFTVAADILTTETSTWPQDGDNLFTSDPDLSLTASTTEVTAQIDRAAMTLIDMTESIINPVEKLFDVSNHQEVASQWFTTSMSGEYEVSSDCTTLNHTLQASIVTLPNLSSSPLTSTSQMPLLPSPMPDLGHKFGQSGLTHSQLTQMTAPQQATAALAFIPTVNAATTTNVKAKLDTSRAKSMSVTNAKESSAPSNPEQSKTDVKVIKAKKQQTKRNFVCPLAGITKCKSKFTHFDNIGKHINKMHPTYTARVENETWIPELKTSLMNNSNSSVSAWNEDVPSTQHQISGNSQDKSARNKFVKPFRKQSEIEDASTDVNEPLAKKRKTLKTSTKAIKSANKAVAKEDSASPLNNNTVQLPTLPAFAQVVAMTSSDVDSMTHMNGMMNPDQRSLLSSYTPTSVGLYASEHSQHNQLPAINPQLLSASHPHLFPPSNHNNLDILSPEPLRKLNTPLLSYETSTEGNVLRDIERRLGR